MFLVFSWVIMCLNVGVFIDFFFFDWVEFRVVYMLWWYWLFILNRVLVI